MDQQQPFDPEDLPTGNADGAGRLFQRFAAEEATPLPQSWDNIRARIQPKRRRFAWWWWPVGILVLGGLASLPYLIQQQRPSNDPLMGPMVAQVPNNDLNTPRNNNSTSGLSDPQQPETQSNNKPNNTETNASPAPIVATENKPAPTAEPRNAAAAINPANQSPTKANPTTTNQAGTSKKPVIVPAQPKQPLVITSEKTDKPESGDAYAKRRKSASHKPTTAAAKSPESIKISGPIAFNQGSKSRTRKANEAADQANGALAKNRNLTEQKPQAKQLESPLPKEDRAGTVNSSVPVADYKGVASQDRSSVPARTTSASAVPKTDSNQAVVAVATREDSNSSQAQEPVTNKPKAPLPNWIVAGQISRMGHSIAASQSEFSALRNITIPPTGSALRLGYMLMAQRSIWANETFALRGGLGLRYQQLALDYEVRGPATYRTIVSGTSIRQELVQNWQQQSLHSQWLELSPLVSGQVRVLGPISIEVAAQYTLPIWSTTGGNGSSDLISKPGSQLVCMPAITFQQGPIQLSTGADWFLPLAPQTSQIKTNNQGVFLRLGYTW